ncbi:mCG148042 [Mus musculus]|uniref:Uncharacterized protein n=1 Tax=Mus musculus TaxID=10090 RepID=Q8BFS0_MOUSE|nr:mCG148042 [Mus musculus]BAC31625.1 unnamed protein product [Mus musculus]BAC38222.1 unnamed protein product [Mus musculus]
MDTPAAVRNIAADKAVGQRRSWAESRDPTWERPGQKPQRRHLPQPSGSQLRDRERKTRCTLAEQRSALRHRAGRWTLPGMVVGLTQPRTPLAIPAAQPVSQEPWTDTSNPCLMLLTNGSEHRGSTVPKRARPRAEVGMGQFQVRIPPPGGRG